jgi:xylulokinase
MYVLGLDASTQSVSALVIDVSDGSLVCEHAIRFGEDLPEYGAPNGFHRGNVEGEVYSNPLMWLDALEMLCRELSGKCDLQMVRAVSGAGQQHGSVYLNAQWFRTIGNLDPTKSLAMQIEPCLSRATAPIWMDTSTSIECIEIAEALGGDDKVRSISGSNCIERFTGPQIRRFMKSSPTGYADTSRIHLVSSFFCSILSGTDAPIDTGDGAGMDLMNIHSFDWDNQLLSATATNLGSKLPSIALGNHQAGKLATYFVERFGFHADCGVTVFTGDNNSSLVGTGASSPGRVVISLGTSDTYFAAMPKVLSDPNGYGQVFGNPSGGYVSLQCFLNGSLARENVKNRFNLDWDEFAKALHETAPGNGKNYMLPFFGPEISPRYKGKEPILRGSREFENWDAVAKYDIIRACVEGQFINMKLRTNWMEMQPDTLLITGGASTNDAVAQIIADVFQAKVQRLVVSGAVALGGAIRAAQHTLGFTLQDLEERFCKRNTDPAVIQPNAATQPVYAEAMVAVAEMLDSLKES